MPEVKLPGDLEKSVPPPLAGAVVVVPFVLTALSVEAVLSARPSSPSEIYEVGPVATEYEVEEGTPTAGTVSGST
jgi:hypothetical protein